MYVVLIDAVHYQELVQLTWVFSRSFSMPYASSSILDGPVNLLIQPIIVQDEDGQNNNKKGML